jgi:hypothetical protein
VGREEGGGKGSRTRANNALIGSTEQTQIRRLLRRVGWVALGVTKAATFVYTAEAVIWPHQPKYHGKGMRIRSLGYLAGLGLVPAVWLAGDQKSRYPVAADLAMSAPMLVDAAGNSLGIYDAARVDDVVHLMNAAVLSSLFGAVISNHVQSREAAAAATFAFGILGEIAFDAMEYGAEYVGFTGLGLSAEDTIADVAMAAIGTTIATAITWARWKPSRAAPLLGYRPA